MAQMGLDEFEKHFETWYQKYWRHVGKIDAKKAYSARLKAGDTPQFLLEKLEQDYQRWRQTEDWRRWRCLLHPATWLNGRRWEDEPPPKANGRVAAAPKVGEMATCGKCENGWVVGSLETAGYCTCEIGHKLREA
jgi:hypothetical protein